MEKKEKRKLEKLGFEVSTSCYNGFKVITLETYVDEENVIFEYEYTGRFDIENFKKHFSEEYENYDIDYETYLWLDNTGHGKRGAPYHIQDILNTKKKIEQLLDKISEI